MVATAAACSTTLEPSTGRFGGLRGVVRRHRRRLQQQRYGNDEAAATPTSFFTPPPVVYGTLAEFPPDTLAHARGVPWHRSPAFGPEWPVADRDDELEAATALTAAASHAGRRSNSGSRATAVTARHRGKPRSSGGAMPFRSMANAATGHSATLMAILLSKLANSSSGEDSGGDTAGAVGTAASAAGSDGSVLGMIPPPPAPAASTAGWSRTELLHRSVDNVAPELENSYGIGPGGVTAAVVGGGGCGGSWAWKARVDQTQRYSKLRRYDFVRELGSGSHGTIFLVRKKRHGDNTTGNTIGSNGVLGTTNKHGSRRSRGSRSSSRSSSGDDHSSGNNSSSSGGMGDLRVLKESQFLSEAVNEARLLSLADDGGGSSVAADAGAFAAKRSAAGDDWCGGVGAGAAASLTRGADRGRGYQRGGVVQVRKERLRRSSVVFYLVWCEGAG